MNILAAFILFTRLPFWRIREVPSERFKNVICYWPLVGWLTGGCMAAVLWLAMQLFPLSVAVILAILSRLALTGALHEDGLADFWDGFGGGNTRDRVLSIMKDSHIGTYGVLGLIIYFLLLYALLTSIPFPLVCMVVIVGDTWSKCVAAQLINRLPYARTEEECKTKAIYNRMSWKELAIVFFCGLLPAVLFFSVKYWTALLFPIVVFFFLYGWMKKCIQGYTGDCCGAMFLLCELSFYLGVVMMLNH